MNPQSHLQLSPEGFLFDHYSGASFTLNRSAVRILELARQMISLAGLAVKDKANPDGDIEITFTGLKPGEKLYEELFIGRNIRETEHERILLCDEVRLRWTEVHQQIRQLATLVELGNEKRAHLLVMALCELGSEDDGQIKKVA